VVGDARHRLVLPLCKGRRVQNGAKAHGWAGVQWRVRDQIRAKAPGTRGRIRDTDMNLLEVLARNGRRGVDLDFIRVINGCAGVGCS
jgi:hypothetical protein